MTPRVFFYVQHLLGIGHLRRAAVLARALGDGGFDVLLVSGGAPVALDLGRARLHQLPPISARDHDLRELAQADGAPADEAFRSARTAELLALFAAEAPAVLITEQFPFGRTRLRFELVPLIAAAHARRPRPLVVCSVRDIVRRTAAPPRVAETLELLAPYDLVLIHADPRLVDFAASFAGFAAIPAQTVYTGYVAQPATAANGNAPDVVGPQGAGKDEVIVSVGGGAVGAPLLAAALAARPLSALADRPWRLLLGPQVPGAIAARLDGGAGVVIEPARPDFAALLRNSVLSISQAGYNTVVDTLCCADRAVLVPFATARETEQADRARALRERGMVAVVPAEQLTPRSLAQGIARALAGPSIGSFPPCNVGGAPATVELLRARFA